LSSAYPITGNNIADGIQFTLGIQFDFAPGKEKATIKKPSTISKGKFVQYDLIAKIISTNDQLYLVKIDQGSDSGVEVGQIFDIFAEEGVIAKAKVTNVKNEESALRVIEYLKEKSIETDTIAKRVVKDQ
jgi:cell shape-determining protein MreC